MTDYSELKDLAESCEISGDDVQLAPDAVLALIAENERLAALLELKTRTNTHNAEALGVASLRVDELEVEVEALRKDAERNQRMLLAACLDLGAIGEALGADANSDGDELLGIVVDLKAQNSRLLGFLSEISKTSGDNGSVLGARQLLKEFVHE